MALKDFERITNTLDYAKRNGINPTSPETWNANYKKRMQTLAGILPNLNLEVKKLQEAIKQSKSK